jgi:futalosine hydrolase
MSLCLAVATAKEYRAAFGALGAPAAPAAGAAVIWRRGGRDWRLLVTGVGPVAAGVSLGRLLGAGGLDGVVNLGLAGSFDLAGAPLGALVAATAETFPEYGLGREGTPPDPKALGFPQITIAGEPIYDQIGLDPDAAARAMGLAVPEGCLRGACATVATVAAEPARSAAATRTPLPLIENMEGFALALACALAETPFLELRTVSNRVGARPPRDWDLAGALASLARTTARLLA